MANALTDVVADDLSREYVEQRADEWVERVSRLVEEVRSILPDGWSGEEESALMHEEMMRQHDVPPRRIPRLLLHGRNGARATLEPYGLWVIGANGRLDLRAPGGKFVIIDQADTDLRHPEPRWMIAPLRDRAQMRDFSADALAAALAA